MAGICESLSVFQGLPIEIRQKIWIEAMGEELLSKPRIVEVTQYSHPYEPQPRLSKYGRNKESNRVILTGDINTQAATFPIKDDSTNKSEHKSGRSTKFCKSEYKWLAHPLTLPCHDLLHACSESRAVVLRHYAQHFTHFEVLEEQPVLNSTMFFNFETDVLYINRQWQENTTDFMDLEKEDELLGKDSTGDMQLWRKIFKSIFSKETLNNQKSLVGCLESGNKLVQCRGVSTETFAGDAELINMQDQGYTGYWQVCDRINRIIGARQTLPLRLMEQAKYEIDPQDCLEDFEHFDTEVDDFHIEEVWVVPGFALVWRVMGHWWFMREREKYEIEFFGKTTRRDRRHQVVSMPFRDGEYRICKYIYSHSS